MRIIDADRLMQHIKHKLCISSFDYLLNSEKAIVNVIESEPSVEMPTWIPCSERLPEENKRVLITTAWGYVTIGWVKQNIWSTDLIVNLRDFVIAWMPLSQPWKGVDDD